MNAQIRLLNLDPEARMDDRPHPHLRTHRDGPVLTITLDNPTRRNAQTPSLWFALADLAATVASQVRVVVLRGEGQSFSAGLDRSLLTAQGLPGEPNFMALAATGQTDALMEAIAQCQRGFSAWRSCPAIVVAAVQGHAIGAGFQLALAADLRVVADDVKMVIAEPQLGMIPDLGGTSPLVRLLGYASALEICVTGRVIGAQEAVSRGLASVAVPREQLQAATDDLVAAILQAPEAPVRALKALLSAAEDSDYETQLRIERTTQVPLLSGLAQAGLAARPSS